MLALLKTEYYQLWYTRNKMYYVVRRYFFSWLGPRTKNHAKYCHKFWIVEGTGGEIGDCFMKWSVLQKRLGNVSWSGLYCRRDWGLFHEVVGTAEETGDCFMKWSVLEERLGTVSWSGRYCRREWKKIATKKSLKKENHFPDWDSDLLLLSRAESVLNPQWPIIIIRSWGESPRFKLTIM